LYLYPSWGSFGFLYYWWWYIKNDTHELKFVLLKRSRWYWGGYTSASF
jgi:hypothetical protein